MGHRKALLGSGDIAATPRNAVRCEKCWVDAPHALGPGIEPLAARVSGKTAGISRNSEELG